LYAYRTIEQPATIEMKEKSSKFIAFAFPVESEMSVKKWIDELWELHPKATHICYAYRLGIDKNQYRANDDGEPSGSAGKPILGQIDSKSVTNILVAVVRYFGGTKLGIPGLIESYKEAAKMVLAQSVIIEKEEMVSYRLLLDIEQYNEVMNALKKIKVMVRQQTFTDKCVLQIDMEKARETMVLDSLHQLYQVNLKIEKEG
jgi:uncharacterized YigZ family protein